MKIIDIEKTLPGRIFIALMKTAVVACWMILAWAFIDGMSYWGSR